jgi:tetratricopeptide (TPR) repeat protein
MSLGNLFHLLTASSHAASLIELFIDHFRRTFDRKSRIALLREAEAELLDVHRALLDLREEDLAAFSLIKLADALRLQDDWNGALKWYEEAEALASKYHNPDREAGALFGKSRTKLLGGLDTAGALADIEHAIPLYERAEETSLLFKALGWKANIQQALGDLDGAMETYDSALKLSDDIDDRGLMFYAHLDRGDIYWDMLGVHIEGGDIEKEKATAREAKMEYQAAIRLADSLGWKGLASTVRELLDGLERYRTALKMLHSLQQDVDSLQKLRDSLQPSDSI